MAKILITIPDLSLPGGVSNIYRSIKWKETDGISYFVNTSPHARNKIWFIPFMFWRFHKKLKEVQLIQLNPSLNAKAIVRDGILLLLSKLLKKRAIVFFHGWDEDFERIITNNSVYRKLFVYVFDKAEAFFLLGPVFGQKLKGIGIKNKKIYFLPTIADDSHFQNNIISSPTERLGRTTLLFISRFDPLKGMDIVLNAFLYLQKNSKVFSFDLIMAGDGSELENCKQFVRKHNLKNVTFTGYVEGLEKHNNYSKADILFFPSYSEGLPCVIMEAMLYGLAVVTRPVGGIPYWVKHDANGWLSECTDAEVFAKGILSIVEKQGMLTKIKENNQKIARSKFTPEKFKEQILFNYKEILDGHY